LAEASVPASEKLAEFQRRANRYTATITAPQAHLSAGQQMQILPTVLRRLVTPEKFDINYCTAKDD